MRTNRRPPPDLRAIVGCVASADHDGRPTGRDDTAPGAVGRGAPPEQSGPSRIHLGMARHEERAARRSTHRAGTQPSARFWMPHAGVKQHDRVGGASPHCEFAPLRAGQARPLNGAVALV